MLDIIKRILQPAVGQLQKAVVPEGHTLLIHVVEKQKQVGLDQQLMGGGAVPAMRKH